MIPVINDRITNKPKQVYTDIFLNSILFLLQFTSASCTVHLFFIFFFLGTSQILDGNASPDLLGPYGPYINVTQMYRRKWPNASTVRWWVQSRPATVGAVGFDLNIADQCDGDITKPTCKTTQVSVPE